MEYTRLGMSGLEISSVVVGCMSFGDPARGTHPWSLPLAESRVVIARALELGITTFDTANVYSAGSSEEIVGQVLGELAKRDEIVIATKVHGRMRPGPGGAGLSRGAILHEIDQSLRRLRTDYVDLYQIHRFDPLVPIEETMEALHDVVKAGKARYIGASSMFAWQFAQMQHAAALNGWTQFISMQDQYNLISREEEREMHPFCLTREWECSPGVRWPAASSPGHGTRRPREAAWMTSASRCTGRRRSPTATSLRPSPRWPRPGTCPALRSHWPGLPSRMWCLPRSWVQQGHSTLRMLWPLSSCN